MDKDLREFPGLQFLFILSGWVLLAIVGYLLLGVFGYHDYEAVISGVTFFEPLKRNLTQLFFNSDGWNLLILTVMLCIGMLMFVINDFLLRKAGKRYVKFQPKRFYYQGAFWAARQCFNIAIAGFEFLVFCFFINIFVSAPFIETPENLHGEKDVLLLGTSKYLRNTNSINIYYQQRINCVADLYKRGLVRRIILSGDTDLENGYNEPLDMANDLMAIGIKKSMLQFDNHGHRTFDSVIRYLALEDSDTVIIVSQLFHLQRALYLAKQIGAKAVGVAADGSMTQSMWRREIFAKSRGILDFYVFNTQAYGLRTENRRPVSLMRSTDLVLLTFVSALIFISGLAFRRVLYF